MGNQLRADFDGDQGTMLVFSGPDPEQYPRAYDKETWLSPEKFVIQKGEWVSYVMTWSAKRKVDYLQGIRRPRWATSIFYKWWYRRVLKQSIKRLLERMTDE